MARAAPQIFAVTVELDGKRYTTTCSSYSGVVTLLHPEYNSGGAILKPGIDREQTAQTLLRSRLERLKERGSLG